MISSKEMKQTLTQVTGGVQIPNFTLNHTDMVKNNHSTPFTQSQIACFRLNDYVLRSCLTMYIETTSSQANKGTYTQITHYTIHWLAGGITR